MTDQLGSGPIVVGVQEAQPPQVLDVAASMAARFGVELVCVSVDASHLSEGLRADGSEIIVPIDPDVGGDPEPVSTALASRIRAVARDHGIEAELRSLVDDVASSLARVAGDCDAALIVVGTKTGVHRLTEVVNGSVAVRLAHQQDRPVLVVPAGASSLTKGGAE